jgi:hypothetical protein
VLVSSVQDLPYGPPATERHLEQKTSALQAPAAIKQQQALLMHAFVRIAEKKCNGIFANFARRSPPRGLRRSRDTSRALAHVARRGRSRRSLIGACERVEANVG